VGKRVVWCLPCAAACVVVSLNFANRHKNEQAEIKVGVKLVWVVMCVIHVWAI